MDFPRRWNRTVWIVHSGGMRGCGVSPDVEEGDVDCLLRWNKAEESGPRRRPLMWIAGPGLHANFAGRLP